MPAKRPCFVTNPRSGPGTPGKITPVATRRVEESSGRGVRGKGPESPPGGSGCFPEIGGWGASVLGRRTRQGVRRPARQRFGSQKVMPRVCKELSEAFKLSLSEELWQPFPLGSARLDGAGDGKLAKVPAPSGRAIRFVARASSPRGVAPQSGFPAFISPQSRRDASSCDRLARTH